MNPAELSGLIPEEVGEALARHAALAEGPIVEIGSYKGKSTAYMAAATDQLVYAVDPWDLPGNPTGRFGFADPSTYQAFLSQTRDLRNVVPVQGFSTDVARVWAQPGIGLLYVDGDHSEKAVYADVMAWLPHLMPKATIILDDWGTPKNPGVRLAAERLRVILNRSYEIEAGRLAVWRL